MQLFEAFILGLVQGLTEFIPISSTAHLRVVPALLGWSDPGVAFSAVIQLGSVAAVVFYFRRDLLSIFLGCVKGAKEGDLSGANVRLALAIILGTMPICAVGLVLKSTLEEPGGPLRSLYVMAFASIVMGLLLALAELIGRRERTLEGMGILDGLIVGVGQAFALIPGCSRSGSTLTVALLANMKREDAARFSFLLGIPAIIISGLVELKEMIDHGMHDAGMLALGMGCVSSTVFSYLSIAWLLRFLNNHSTWLFIGYRVLFGLAVLALAMKQIIR